MSLVRCKDTKPELAVRRLVSKLGYRYRKNATHLPGKPDIVFFGRRKIIFVHGCFWHSHTCALGRKPKSREDFWLPKLESNRKRDRRVRNELKREGWNVLILWECQIKNIDRISQRLKVFLDA